MKFKPLYLSVLIAAAISTFAVGQGDVFSDPLAEENDMARLLPPKERLGRLLFNDTNLSEPAGQSCASCHAANLAFTDPDKFSPTSQGINPQLFGNRNTPAAAYAAFSPYFHFDAEEGLYVGGQFWDGRAATLEAQAKGPFLNPVEMANTSKQQVVDKVKTANYAPLFKGVFGQDAFDDTEAAYDRIADAIAAFERTRTFNKFTSKFDAWLDGKATLTSQEMRGLELFEREDKGNCAACHTSRPTEGRPPLFTDFTYDNLGVPKNPHNAFYKMSKQYNPDGKSFVDKGLGGIVNLASEDGKFKVPTLRNIALTAPYMHNGYFNALRDVVDFYNSRDVKPVCTKEFVADNEAVKKGCWPKPEVAENVNADELGNLRLSDQEVDDIVAFMNTLTDGWIPAN
jgi:cytochrome c peroxidase